MSTDENPLSKQIVVRLDDVLLQGLKRDAEANGRTLAQTVRFLLRRAVQA